MKRIFYTLSIVVLISACAQVSSPSGGPKDEIPPRDSVCLPQNYSTEFKEKKINIRFTEFINLKDLNNNLIISPFSKTLPNVTVNGKNIQIEIKDTLQTNTTYVYNFGNAITDITEGNIAENFKYVFSTGNFIDTLKISGQVLNSFTYKPEEGFVVMLYDLNIDSAPLTQVPTYIAKTNKEGNFLFSNIKNNKYKIFALNDNNRNYLFDLPDEVIAYSSNLLIPDTNVTLYSFKEENEKQFVKKYAEEIPGKIGIYFNKLSDKINVIAQDSAYLIKEKYTQNDTIVYWLTKPPQADKLNFIVYDSDSLIDTLVLRNVSFEKATKEKTITHFNIQNSKLNLSEDLIITFSRPVNYITDTLLILYIDSIPVQAKFNFDGLRKLHITADWKENANCKLQLLPGFFKDIYSYSNDTVQRDFQIQERKYYGNLILKLQGNNNQHYIFHLLNEKDEIIKKDEFTSSAKINYNQLIPGKYKMRIIEDVNNNSKWDTGNYIKNNQPEKVIVYSGTLNIRSNWDQEIEWFIEPR